MSTNDTSDAQDPQELQDVPHLDRIAGYVNDPYRGRVYLTNQDMYRIGRGNRRRAKDERLARDFARQQKSS